MLPACHCPMSTRVVWTLLPVIISPARLNCSITELWISRGYWVDWLNILRPNLIIIIIIMVWANSIHIEYEYRFSPIIMYREESSETFWRPWWPDGRGPFELLWNTAWYQAQIRRIRRITQVSSSFMFSWRTQPCGQEWVAKLVTTRDEPHFRSGRSWTKTGLPSMIDSTPPRSVFHVQDN